MLTPQEVQDVKFAKARFGGYNMAEVDEFLDRIMADYEQLYKENAILKSKLKTIAEKLEEYRSVDEQMRRELARAKRESEETIEEARKRAAEMKQSADDYAASVRADADSYSEKLLANARAESADMLERSKRAAEDMQDTARSEAMQKLGSIREEIDAEERRLGDVRARTLSYAEEVTDAFKRHLASLRTITSEPAAVAETAPAETPAETPAEPMARAAFAPAGGSIDEPTIRITGRHAEESPAPAATAAERIDFDIPLPGEVEEPTKRFDAQKEPTIRFETRRRVEIGGETVEIGDEDDEQSDDDAFRQIFGDRGSDGE